MTYTEWIHVPIKIFQLRQKAKRVLRNVEKLFRDYLSELPQTKSTARLDG